MHGRTINVQTKLQVSAMLRSAPMLASQGWLDTASEPNEASVVSSLNIRRLHRGLAAGELLPCDVPELTA
jgi:hypothetical protein